MLTTDNTILFTELPNMYQDMLAGYLTAKQFSQMTSGASSLINTYTGLLVRQSVVSYCNDSDTWTSDDIIQIISGQQPITRERIQRVIDAAIIPQSNNWMLLGWMPEIMPCSERLRAVAFMDKQLRRDEDQDEKTERFNEWLAGGQIENRDMNQVRDTFVCDENTYSTYNPVEFDTPEQWSAFVGIMRK